MTGCKTSFILRSIYDLLQVWIEGYIGWFIAIFMAGVDFDLSKYICKHDYALVKQNLEHKILDLFKYVLQNSIHKLKRNTS